MRKFVRIEIVENLIASVTQILMVVAVELWYKGW